MNEFSIMYEGRELSLKSNTKNVQSRHLEDTDLSIEKQNDASEASLQLVRYLFMLGELIE